MSAHTWTVIAALFAGQLVGALIALALRSWWVARRSRGQWTTIEELEPDPELEKWVLDTLGTGKTVAGRVTLLTSETPHNDSIEFEGEERP